MKNFKKNLENDANLFIFNVNSQLIYKSIINKNSNQIDIKRIHYPVGVYYISIVNEELNLKQSFIVK